MFSAGQIVKVVFPGGPECGRITHVLSYSFGTVYRLVLNNGKIQYTKDDIDMICLNPLNRRK